MKTFLSIIRNIPEPLKKFLKEKGVYKRYIKNCLNWDLTTKSTHRSSNMYLAFSWIDSPENYDFWSNLHDEFLNLKK